MDKTSLENIIGNIERILYRNPDNDYLICKIRCEDSSDLITAVGYAIELQPGERLSVKGKWTINKKYGRQFEIDSFQVLVPVTEEGIEKYLGSGMIKGIGPVIAKRIVKKFKTSTLKILDEEPDKLNEIEGLAKKRIILIKNEWKKQKDIREIIIFMQSYGVSNNYAAKIFSFYGDNSISVLKSNPYKMIEDVRGIGFKTADRIAENIGIDKDSVFRIKSGVIYLLNQITDSGNCYYPEEELVTSAIELMDVGDASIRSAISGLVDDGKITKRCDSDRIYLKNIYDDEVTTAMKLIKIRDYKENGNDKKSLEASLLNDNNTIGAEVDIIAGIKEIELDETQTDAVKKAVTEKLLIITGSPGTGKSTILNIIIEYYRRNEKKVLIAAPTGRASKRLTEATGVEAKTIHRLLKYQPKLNKFLKNETDQLEADLIIIDEASMMDIRLFKALLNAVKDSSNLILVGDIDQLPAVGPGNVLADIINSEVFNVVRLNYIYRQGGKSQILYNAHRIRDGIFPVLSNSKYKDFYFLEKTEPEAVIDIILDLLIEKIPRSFQYDVRNDVQVIVPTNRGAVGVINLNSRIQEKLNKNKKKIIRGSIEYRLNDKVIQLRNNYEKEVFNGDIGFIDLIDFEVQEVVIDFEGRKVSYDFYELDEISLSYAISIHKSQGSEFKCVIIPILTSHYMLLQKNLLYTAITRAREVAILIGSKKAIGIAVNRNSVENRYTGLRELLVAPD